MTEIIGVRFKRTCKVYYFAPGAGRFAPGDPVIVETQRGIELGETVIGNEMVEDEEVVAPLKKAIRHATPQDLSQAEKMAAKEKDAMVIATKKVASHGLDMKIVRVECVFDSSKILFYFTADGRIDFRELVKELASSFRTRIELRQIGVRDEAKMLGGLGICGRELCCSSFLDDFQPVSINMAKEQNLSLNPAKISGTCGRLMCCLKYEFETYKDLNKTAPRVNSIVDSPAGEGTIVDVNLLRQTCMVRLDNDAENVAHAFPCSECKILKSAEKTKRGNKKTGRKSSVQPPPPSKNK